MPKTPSSRSTEEGAVMAATGVERSSQYLTFRLGEEVFALDIAQVREVLDYTPITRVPRMPEFMRGVINLRGSVVPVVDLRARFGIEEVQASRSTCIVVAEVRFHGESMVVGLLTDAVNAVVELRAQDLLPVHVGLGTAARARITIRWPSGWCTAANTAGRWRACCARRAHTA
jgi:purine-binding chemotaxis protein CheW